MARWSISSWIGEPINTGIDIAKDIAIPVIEKLLPGETARSHGDSNMGLGEETQYYTIFDAGNCQYIGALDKHKRLQYAVPLEHVTSEKVDSDPLFKERITRYRRQALVYRLIRYAIYGILAIMGGGVLYLLYAGGYLK